MKFMKAAGSENFIRYSTVAIFPQNLSSFFFFFFFFFLKRYFSVLVHLKD